MLEKFGLVNDYEKLGSGDKLRYFYVSKPNKFGLSVIGYKYYYPKEFANILEPDRETMFAKIVYSVTERFYDSVGWKVKSPSMMAQTDLFDLLKL